MSANLQDQVTAECNIAWAAGIVEGEGCMSLVKTKSGLYPKLTVQMSDEDIILRLKDILNCGTVSSHQRGINKRLYQLNVYTKSDLYETIKVLYPYFGKRRKEKAEEVMTFLENKYGF